MEGRNKKVTSNPLKSQRPKETEEARKPTKICTRCDHFSNDEFCGTHKRITAENKKEHNETVKASSSKPFPTMLTRELPEVTLI